MQHIVYVIKRATKKNASAANQSFAFKLEKDAKQFFADFIDGKSGDIVIRKNNQDLMQIKFI